MGLLSNRWVTQGDETDLANRLRFGVQAAGNTPSGRIDPYETTGLPDFQMPTDAATWAKLGYTGPVLANQFGTVNSDGYQDMSLSPELQAFIADRGLKPAVSRVGNSAEMGVAGPSGEVTPTSQWNAGDHQFWNGALASAALVGGSVANNPAYGGASESAPVAGTNTLGPGPSPIGPGQGGMLAEVGQYTMPTLAEVPAMPTILPSAGEALGAAGAAKSLAPDDENYSNEGGNYPTPDSTGGSPVNSWDNPFSDFAAWAKANPQLAKLLFAGAGSAIGGSGGSGGGGYVDSGYRPTISRGGFMSQASPTLSPTQSVAGLISMPGQPGAQNSGLWRYGLLGGK